MKYVHESTKHNNTFTESKDQSLVSIVRDVGYLFFHETTTHIQSNN